MNYQDSNSTLDTPGKILKVNHAGEFGAVNIYRSQLLIARLFIKDLVPMIEDFLADEKRHLDIFWTEIQRRNGVKCKSYWFWNAVERIASDSSSGRISNAYESGLPADEQL